MIKSTLVTLSPYLIVLQVEHLFTDKTGTLTENNLEFRQLSAGGVKYTDYDNKLCLLPSQPGATPKPVGYSKPVSSNQSNLL